MNATNGQPKLRRKYDRTFKREAVEHWLKSDKSAAAIGQELGIEANRLYRWKEQLGLHVASGTTALTLEELQVENARLRRDNEGLRQQREILKKTLGILSEPPRNATNASNS